MGIEFSAKENLLNYNSDCIDKTQGREENYPKKGVDSDIGMTHKDLSGVEISECLA